MAVELLFRRGDTLSNDGFTGKAGSITLDTELHQLRIHDGVTPGGHKVPTGSQISDIEDLIAGIGIADVDGLQDALDLLTGANEALEQQVAGFEDRIAATELSLADKIDASEKGAADGVATLGEGGKIPMSQLPDALVGQVEYHGTWDGSTNTPTLPETPEKKGEYYVTSVAGTFAGLEFEVGDWIISDGVKWDKVDNTDAVMSVNGQIGAVELTKEDLELGLVDNTADADKPVSTPQQEALDLKADISFVEEQIAGIDAGVVTVVGTGAVKVDATDAANPVVSVDEATAEAAGLMSAADKAKLDGFDPESIIGAVESVNGQTGVVVITKADVELGLVDNFATADATVAAAGESADTFVTPLGVRQFIEAMGFVQDESGDWSADQGEL